MVNLPNGSVGVLCSLGWFVGSLRYWFLGVVALQNARADGVLSSVGVGVGAGVGGILAVFGCQFLGYCVFLFMSSFCDLLILMSLQFVLGMPCLSKLR